VTAAYFGAGAGNLSRRGAGGWGHLRAIARHHRVSIRQAFAIVRLVGLDQVAIALAASRLRRQP
jgi:hypothetical protein